MDVRLSKPGNVEVEDLVWTHRWKDTTAMPEITQWQDSETRSIILSDGLLGEGVQVRVRRFKRLDGDRTKRSWWDEKLGKERHVEIKDYALVDMATVKVDYEKYLSKVHSEMFARGEGRHSATQREIFEELLGPKDGLLWKSYQQAQHRRDDEEVSVLERDLLTKVLDLWVAVRLTTRSFEITGKETLGISQVRNKQGVLQTLLPPVMGENFPTPSPS